VSDPVISLRGVGKRYLKYQDRRMLFTAALRLRGRTSRSDFWAVRDVDLDFEAGESVGFLGRNGAGKSTMLQMLAGVTAPSEGTVRVDGRVSPLISVGVGFHPELTGRENVYVNGTILGMSRQTIDRRFDDIVAFAELEEFIDTPVKFYSSGMFVRLGFSVAIEADPDILLVDEILAVGDFAFQLKCYERMQQIRNRGTTIIVVSHNLGAIRTFCDRGIVMNHGRIVHDGRMFDAIGVYHELMAVSERDDDTQGQAFETDSVEILDARLSLPDGSPAAHVNAGDDLVYAITVKANRDVERPFAALVIGTGDRDVCVYSDSNVRAVYPSLRAGEVATYEVRFPASFPTGSYRAELNLLRLEENRNRVGIARGPGVSFYISGRPMVGGIADLHASFVSSDPAQAS
jgi:ABC-2 type transport system ATP-binding protein